MVTDAFVGMDGYGRITDWNDQAEATFGWRQEEVLGRGLAETIISPQHREAHRAGLARFLATGEANFVNQHIEITAIDRHGREFPVELAVRALDEGTDTVRFHAFVRDISERRAYQDALRDSETKHRLLARQLAAAQQTAGIGSWEWDIAANTVSWSEELYRILKIEPGQHPPTYEDYVAGVHPEDRALVEAAIDHAFATGEPFGFDHRLALSDGSVRIVRCRGDVAVDETGAAVCMMGTAHDVTDREMIAEALRESERRLAEAQSTARLGSWEWDIAADRVTWSPELCHLFGVDPTTFGATYQGYLDHIHPEDRELAASTIRAAFEAREDFAFDHRLARPGGPVVWVHGRGQLEMGADGVPVRMSGTAADITERVTFEQELAALALIDDLTGLHNRRSFVTLADHQLKVAGRARRSVPLLFIDMDGMKTINDTYGHIEGDRALVEVAKFLRTTFRSSDVVARLGGDEFCILMVDDGSGGRILVDRVLAELRAGPPRGQRPYALSLSVGVSWLEPGSRTSVEDLMSQADAAMYKDKSSQHQLARALVAEAGDQRDQVADQRDHVGDQRDHVADQRDHAGDQRDHVGDQRDQVADQRDHAGQERDQVADQRDHVAEKRDQVAGQRDQVAGQRDQVAGQRDQVAGQRDQVAGQRDRPGPQSAQWVSRGITADVLKRSALARQEAASDRTRASKERRAAAGERTEAEQDRDTASADRRVAAGERTEAEQDRDTASAHRGEAAGERTEAEQDRDTASADRGAGVRIPVRRLQ